MNFAMVTKSFRLALGLALSMVAARPVVASITLLDTQGFEPPLFSTTFDAGGTGDPGQLAGQPQVPPSETWTQAGPDTSTATIQTGFALETQAVELQYGGGDTRWGVPMSINPLTVTVSFDLAYTASTPPTVPGVGPFGPLYGVEAFDASAGPVSLIGSVFVDTSNGELVYQETGTGFITAIASVAPLTPSVFYGIDLVLDYTAQQYSIFVNDVLALGGIGFVDGEATAFTDASLAAISGGVDPTGFLGAGFVDNFVITAVVPEFSTGLMWAGLASIAGGGCWWKRRRTTVA
jgi:hypothetical protein